MNTTVKMDEAETTINEKPGAYLATVRESKGYSPDYVARRLNLRVQLIELLEEDVYHKMPEPVFIKGYIRAYAKLLEISADPLLEAFNGFYTPQTKIQKTLWQKNRQTNKAEHAVRWLTIIFALSVITAVAVWWYNNKENEKLFPVEVSRREAATTTTAAVIGNRAETENRLTNDLLKLRSLLSSGKNQYSSIGNQGG